MPLVRKYGCGPDRNPLHRHAETINKKKFQNLLHEKRYLVAVDGTQKYVMDECWDERYLRRKIRGKDGDQYYAYVLEAVLLCSNGMVLPLMSIFLENSGELEAIENDEEWKQDCECGDITTSCILAAC